MDNQEGAPDINADEAAAQAIQEAIWLEEELADPDVAHQLLNNNNNNGVPELVRQLLRQRRAGINGGAAAAGEAANQEEEELPNEEEEEVDGEAIDAGVAGEVFDDSQNRITRPVKCPIMLYLEIDDDIEDLCPSNKYLKRGSTVYTGLDKTTKLEAVFQQFCTFVNKEAKSQDHVKLTDFEFVHCTLLDKNHTVEASAMMKNDRIKVRRDGSKERAQKAEVARLQRESDRKYFADLRQLLQNSQDVTRGCDLILDCKGKVVDERGYSQNVLITTVKANSAMLSKRCKWLADKIEDAKDEMRRREEMTVPEEGKEEGKDDEGKDDSFEGKSDDEDDIVPSFPDRENAAVGGANHSIKVEDDDDEEDLPPPKKDKATKGSPNSVVVTLDHSPEAVKLLLEYCYTNRVISLGFFAFSKSSKHVGPHGVKEPGPVAPFRKHDWPLNGKPQVSLHLALAGVALAEEAQLPRLSLMCELAASQLLNENNILDVLSACHSQLLKTGNRLPILRKAAMSEFYATGGTGISRFLDKAPFKAVFQEKSALLVPSLLDGTVELLPPNMLAIKEWQKKKDKMEADTSASFVNEDKMDRNKRELQRKKNRQMDTINQRLLAAFGPDDLAISSPRAHYNRNREEPPPIKFHRVHKRKSRSSGDAHKATRRSKREKPSY
ncbi:hypothetical protein ACHAWO_006816 [Cyclotella atomus]|uniref:Uncharacterized protein n=1 Tax=Cyclotella atomus TaxID=382360 RepID=A0ABD3NI56_9STRA